MTTFPNSPKLIKGGIVLLDPESMSRSFQIQQADGDDGGDRSQTLRLKTRW